MIARKSTDRPGMRPFDRETCRRRSVVEQSVGWLREARRIGTRFEKYAANFLGMLKLAFIQRYLRVLDPSNTAWTCAATGRSASHDARENKPYFRIWLALR